MPLARVIPRITAGLAFLALSACAGSLPSSEEFMRMPREIRTGRADMVIQRVEQSVEPAEVAAAVQALVAQAPLCFPWPGLWLDASERRNFYYARYDLMARDWGQDVAATNRARMQEFVDMGFLIASERPDIGPGVVEYTLTTDGDDYLRGSPYGGARPSFCGPSQRRLAQVESMEWGQYPCGSLRVRFSHVGDDWPTWARTESARERVAAAWAQPGEPLAGEVTLSRQWFRTGRLPSGRTNGALVSVCFDAARQQVTGDDLRLSLSPAS